MTRKPITDARRLSHAIDRLDAVSATDREAAARHVFDVCVYHVTRVRKAHPGPHHRGRGRLTPIPADPTSHLVFDLVHPHIYRITRRLDRAMRYAEISPHPADAAALIVAVDAQGALAALFAVAQNAGVSPSELDVLAFPLRKRSAPALLRTLFSPDMRVANAAKKALRQIAAIASCQNTPWMSTIRAGLSLRSGAKANRSILLRNLLSRLAEILQLVVTQATDSQSLGDKNLHRKRSSRSSLGNLMAKPRPSLISERKAQEKMKLKAERSFFDFFRRKNGSLSRNSSRVSTIESDISGKSKRKFRTTTSYSRRSGRTDSLDDMHSHTSHGVASTGGSYPGSVYSNVTESGVASSRQTGKAPQRETEPTIKRDAATAMYIFERLLAKRTNPNLEDRIEVISALADIAFATFSGQYANTHKIQNPEGYMDAMAAVFRKHGQRIYSVILEVLFRPVREADANRIGVFSFEDTGIVDIGGEIPLTRRKLAEFPQSAVCLPNMDCTGMAAVSCNSLLKIFLRYVPEACCQRMALLTGTINTAFLHSSEALKRTQYGCSWDVSKIVSAVDALTVLVSVIPTTVENALELIVREPVTLRLVIQTCIRSVSATGRLLAQNAARASAPKLSDEGTLDSLRSWQALIRIMPNTSTWSGTPSYSSSILFLAQVARRAALISVLQAYRKDRLKRRSRQEGISDDRYPSTSSLGSNAPSTKNTGLDDGNGAAPIASAGKAIGFEAREENVLTAELHQCIIAMINVPGTSPGDVFFELYRAVVYLYANDLKKHHKRERRKSAPGLSTAGPSDTVAKSMQNETKDPRRLSAPASEFRTQSDEDAQGVLIENIAVDGQLPSRALRKAVMASELDLGEYFDGGQPPSLQHLGTTNRTGLPPGVNTFEEFSHALAIIIGTLSNETITENFEDPEEAEAMISRDVQRSGSAYLQRVYKRAKSILRRDMLNQDYDWRSIRYEERIRKLEEQVASLKSMVEASIEDSMTMSRRKSLPKMLGRSQDSVPRDLQDYEHVHEINCGHTRCFCVS